MPINFSPYVSLTQFDASPTDIYLDSIEYTRLVLPEFQPRQGTPEDAILQAMSYISSLNISAINRLPDRVMAGLVGMMGLDLNEGLKSVIDIKFTATSADGATVPQGTVVRYDYELLGQRNSLYYETSEELVIEAVDELDPLPYGIVEAQNLYVGETVPLGIGTVLEIETPTTDILGAEINLSVFRGQYPETEIEYLTRAVQHLASLSSSFAKSTQVDAYINASYKNTVSRSKTYDLTNAEGDLLFSDPDEVGYITIFVYGIGGFTTAEQKTDLLVDVSGKSVAGLEIGINDARLIELDVFATVGYSSQYESSVVLSNIKSILGSYFSPATYRFSDTIKLSEFYAAISSVPGVVYVTELSVVPQDLTIAQNDGSGNIDFFHKGSLPNVSSSGMTITLTSVNTQ